MSKRTLRYQGAASLTFREADGTRRTVLRGEAFTTDEKTAMGLLASDPFVVEASGVTSVKVTSTTTTTEVEVTGQSEDLDGLTVAVLRERLEAAGLAAKGNKAELVGRLGAFTAGQTSTAAQSGMSANPLVEDPASSEAEPLAPPPPTGGTAPVPGPTISASEAEATGVVTIGDLPESAKNK